MDEWKYITLFSSDNITHDFRIQLKPDVIDLVVAVSDAAARLNNDYFGMTNPQLVSSIINKLKLQKFAAKQGLTVTQMFLVAMYRTASLEFKEDTMFEKKEKFIKLKTLFRLCERKGVVEDDLDMSKAKYLKKAISKRLEIQVECLLEEDGPQDRSAEPCVFDSSDSEDEHRSAGGTSYGKSVKAEMRKKMLKLSSMDVKRLSKKNKASKAKSEKEKGSKGSPRSMFMTIV